MNLNELFGSTFDCPCGRRHQIVPRRVVLADDAIAQMPAICAEVAGGRRAAVLVDVRTRAAAGAAVTHALIGAGWQVSEVIISDPPVGSPVCDDVTHDWLTERVKPADLIVPVGSGVICDLGKWLAFDRELPFVPFATAASMNGYGSGNVAPTIAGLKTLFRAVPPPAAASSLPVLCGAPPDMTTAGLGDALARSISSADWYLNHVLFGDYYCQRCVDMLSEIEPLYVSRPAALAAGDREAMAGLFMVLMAAGPVMTLAGSSAPASGGEHLVSHTLDMMSSLDDGPHDLHGRQVGMGALLCAEVYRRVLAVNSPELRPPAETIDHPFWGRLAGATAEQYAQKLPRLRQVAEKLSAGGVWDDLRSKLAAITRPPQAMADCLRAAGGAFRAEHLGCDRKRLLDAFVHAHQARARFTILDLAGLMGLMPQAARDIIEQWA